MRLRTMMEMPDPSPNDLGKDWSAGFSLIQLSGQLAKATQQAEACIPAALMVATALFFTLRSPNASAHPAHAETGQLSLRGRL